MLKLFKSLFLVLSVLIRSLLRRRKISSILIAAIGLMIFIFIFFHFFKGQTCYQSTYPLSPEVLSNMTDDTLGIKFRGFPSISPDGRYVAYNDILLEGRDIKDVNVCLYDTKENKLVDLPGLNSTAWDISPSLSAGGRFIVFQSNRTGKHSWHVYLYDTQAKKFVDLPGLNSLVMDINPTISADGNLITFTSVRSGRLEIYLYDRRTAKVSPIPVF